MSNDRIPADWLPHYSYEDYKQWEGHWELIRGIPYAMSPGPLRKHQVVGGQFVYVAIAALREQGVACNCEVLYEADWIINEDTIVKPDVMILCDAPPSDFVRVPPVLVLEIFSPATRLKDRNLKFRLYEENGVRYYLMADPDRKSLEIFELNNNRFEEAEPSVFQLTPQCALAIDLRSIWA